MPDTAVPSACPAPRPIEKSLPEAPLRDVMAGASRWTIPIHEHGFIALVDAMPRLVPEGQTADSAIVQSARVSYGQGTKMVSEDRGLVRYLMRHRHSTPFEMVEFKFHIAMPIFIARQWIRHRTANVNEYSTRYSIAIDLVKSPPATALLKKAAKIDKGSGKAHLDKVGKVTREQLEEIAKIKMKDLNAANLEGAVKIIAGSARSIGIVVEGV